MTIPEYQVTIPPPDILMNASQETMHKEIGIRKTVTVTPKVKYIDKYIIYLSPSYVDTEPFRLNGPLVAGKYYFIDETGDVDGNGPYDTEEQCREAFREYCNYLERDL